MDLPPVNLPPLSRGEALTPETLPTAVRSWQVGQILHATVSGRPTAQTATLRFGAHEVPVQTRIPLTQGEALTVRVAQLGETITLRLQNAPPRADASVAEALRSALPRQQSLAPLLANLGRLLAPRQTQSPSAKPPPPLPPEIQKLVRQLFDALPEVRRVITPEGVKQAIRDSGTFAETKLADSANRGTPPSTSDIKLNLVRLSETLQTYLRAAPAPAQSATVKPLPLPLPIAPPLRDQAPLAQPRVAPSVVQLLENNASLIRIVQELAAQIEGALARVQVAQIASLPGDQAPTQVWAAEVPVRHEQQTDLFQFRIEHRRASGAQADEYWSITFAFELEELGAMRARVVFYQQELSATLWAEREATARKFKERLAELRKRIEDHGLPVRSLDCLHGIPDSDAPPPSGGLIYEQA